MGSIHGTEVLAPQPHSILLSASAGIFDAPSLSIDQIKKVLEIYHQQNPNRSRYTVIQSTLGFHIIPTHAHDADGVLREVKSVFDTPVEILPAERTAAEHVQALLDTLTRLTGIPFTWGSPNIDGFYAANGYTLPMAVISEDRPYMLFEWGAHGTNARDALIDLLKNSATTMTWTLNCGPDYQLGNQPICNFGLSPLIVEGRIISLDRCTRCKVLPRQEVRSAR